MPYSKSLTPSPTWPTSFRAPDLNDLPLVANEQDMAQRLVNASEALRYRTDGAAFATTELYPTSNHLAAVEFPQIGAIVALTATTVELLAIGNPQVRLSTAALPGGVTLTSASGAFNGTDRVVFATSSGAFYMGTGSALVAGTGYCHTAVAWSAAAGKFFGTHGPGTSGGTARVAFSVDGAAFTEASSSANSSWEFLARNSDGTKLLAAGLGGDGKVAYSADSGATWTVYATTIDGSSTWKCGGLTYDDSRGLWLCTAPTVAGAELKIWKLETPSAGAAWSLAGTAPSAIRGGSTYIAAYEIQALPNGVWAVSVGENTVGDVCLTADEGATWGRQLGLSWPVAVETAHRLSRVGQRLGVKLGGVGANPLHVTGPIWPTYV